MMRRWLLALLTGLLLPGNAPAVMMDQQPLQQALDDIAASAKARVGICAQQGDTAICHAGDQRFSMQSVVKMITVLAVLDRVDHGGWRLDAPVTVMQNDLAIGVQPIAKK